MLKKSTLRKDIQRANVDMLREMHIEPTALDNGFVPVDIDVTPFDNSKSNKEGVSRTYKGFDGYAPIMVYFIVPDIELDKHFPARRNRH